MNENVLDRIILPDALYNLVSSGVNTIVPEDRNHLLFLAMGDEKNMTFEVAYNVPNKGRVVEASVVKCKYGIVVNYTDIWQSQPIPRR